MDKVKYNFDIFWKFFNNCLLSVISIFSCLIGLRFVTLTLISKNASNEICSELYFLQNAWWKHIFIYHKEWR